MSVPSIQEKIRKYPKLAENKNIIKACLDREKKLNKKYFVLYTSIPHFTLFQDTFKKLYTLNSHPQGALQQNQFHFLRYAHKDTVYNAYKNAQDFIIKETQQEGIIDDNLSRVKPTLLSTNVSLFGNADFFGESTFHYFNNPQKWVKANPILMNKMLDSFNYSRKYAKELLALQSLIQTDRGDLFQIFIPKNMVDEVGYVSWRQGIPLNTQIIKKMINRENLYTQDTYSDLVKSFKQQLQKNDPVARAISQTFIDDAKKGTYSLNRLLTQYMQAPDKLSHTNNYQARLVFTNDKLLNPESGILIFRYTKVSLAKQKEYEDKLDALITKMHAEKIATPQTKPTTPSGPSIDDQTLQKIEALLKKYRDAGIALPPKVQEIEKILQQAAPAA